MGVNRERVCQTLGFEPERLRFVRQVHGTDLLEPTAPNWPSGGEQTAPAADGLLTDRPDLLLGVRSADCLPVLLAAIDACAVAAVHAGWRSLTGGILGLAVERLRRLAGSKELVAAIGPGIGPAAYEVGPEVAEHFPETLKTAGAPGRWRVDLAGLAARRLLAAGVAEVEVCRRSTFNEPTWFFSHRRDGPRTGRQAGFIAAGR